MMNSTGYGTLVFYQRRKKKKKKEKSAPLMSFIAGQLSCCGPTLLNASFLVPQPLIM